jgi:putative membrane protein
VGCHLRRSELPKTGSQARDSSGEKETTMMNWYGNGMNGWGYGLMGVSMLLFWVLVIAGVVVLVRYLGGHGQRASNVPPAQRTPEQILAERFARGDINEDEYTRRLQVLSSATDRNSGN